MDRALIRKQYATKQKERAAETNPLRKRKLFEEERDLRIQLELPHPNGGCYVDGKPVELASDVWPFCSSPCHERWSGLNNYSELVVTGASDLDIRRRQQRALEIASEIREKKGVHAAR